MSYSDFTLQTVVKELQLMLNERTKLFVQIPESTMYRRHVGGTLV
jgi:hypothetical protein